MDAIAGVLLDPDDDHLADAATVWSSIREAGGAAALGELQALLR